MADIHELMLAMNLRSNLSETELAELRWHLGLGPRPEHLTDETVIVNDVLDLLDEDQKPTRDENGDWVIKKPPLPAWHDGSPYKAAKMPGVAFSTLVHDNDRFGEPWSLTCRWEIHPDGHEQLAKLVDWLTARLHEEHRSFFGYQRWYEDEEPELLELQDGKVVTRRDGVFRPPFWEYAQDALD